MGWVESGRAWGDRATDWAYLCEPYARRVNDALFDRAKVGPGTRLLDIACGSGYAASVAAGRGTQVSGLDASEALIAIARARTPAADFRVGDMFALPFEDDCFDVAVSFNGIWKGCEEVHLPQLTASDLASVTLTGTVSATDDTVKLTLGSTAYATSGRDLGLYGNWNQTQWGVYGMPPPAGSGEAFFDPMSSALEADTAFVASTGAAPQCVQRTGPPGMTAEYNNLSLSTTAEPPSLGPHPTVASFQVFQIPAPPATAATCVAQPAGVAPSISPAAYSVTHLPAGTSSYSCPSGRLCLQVDDPTTGGTTVFDLYYCKTYALSHWLYWGEYTDNQTGSSTTTYFYGASTSQVLAQFTPTGTQQHTYNWTPVNWIKAC